ncbi:MAG TPA: methyltransferase domain-containing protein [Candidatus Limnocylindrales bacterium]|nr:methyltransferase domain-containing protein [Candidatus Limnocylindrales bacterium]
MRRLEGARELLDGPLDDAATVVGNLRDLRRINRRLGGVAISAAAVMELAGDPPRAVSLLDVGTGSADIPLELVRRLRAQGRAAGAVAVDSRAEIVDLARTLDPRLQHADGVELAVADGRALPYGDGTFDIVHASLLVHHLEPRDAVALLREARRVARRGVVVNDLVRAHHFWWLARALVALTTRNPITRNDAPLSVRRAYTRMELRALLASAGLRPIHEAVAVLGHRVAIAAVPIVDSPPRP